uniref:Acyl-CoA dehydrogenase n=1 Tax=Panagrolaimus sp. JU765 TaxID=591449 RepID=A0AC34RK58_9BILA
MLSRFQRSSHYVTRIASARLSSNEIAKQKPVQVVAKEANIPIERTSLSRGLALNKFEKDFMIFPEFEYREDVEAIKAYAQKVKNELDTVLSGVKNPSDLDSNVLAVLLKNGIFQCFVPKEYGGSDLCHKDLLCITESLGVDLSTFTLVNQTCIASRLLQIYGTEEQKQKYLPKLASFQMKPAICLHDVAGEKTEVLAYKGVDKKLNGWKTDVINGDIADIYFVFATDVTQESNESFSTCYIVDKSEITNGQISVAEKKKTQGLCGVHLSKLNFSNISVREENILGGPGGGNEAANEVMSFGNFYLGSAVVGFMKKALNELASLSNTTIHGNRRLAENVAIQKALSQIAIDLFVIESVVYYLGGLMDEGLVLTTDIENAIVQHLINKVLRQTFTTITQVAGSAATDEAQIYDQMIRDLNTLLSLNVSDLNLAKTISLSMIVTWVEQSHYESRFKKSDALKRLFNLHKNENAWNNPKLKHFIAEHVHPSLEPAARRLENTMSRLDTALNRIVEDSGSRVKEDVATLLSLARIIENNLAMIATISRASRSYSIGLRNADIELIWATSFCHNAARQSKQELEFIMDHYGLIKTNPTVANIGAAVVEFGGYPLEKPIEKNW